ncbi:MAG: recombinase family protein [Bacteroidia bacterium]
MKKKAILYTRVSTDDQNDGYSPADQKERLVKYCDQMGIDVIAFFHDDESGKSFDRPEWYNIMTFIKKHKGTIDLLLFIKWDRFSRNVAEAYIAIKELQKYRVEPQAIEQPLDFSIPESKIMLAVYLAAPEVDNDRRALNVFLGIRRAKKEGRLLGGCPRGYKNARDEKNEPIVIPEGGKQQALIQEAFELFAKGYYPIEDLRRLMYQKGLKLSRNAFWCLLRNKVYIGMINVPAYKDEPSIWVPGQHEAIIDEITFYKVQEILQARKRNIPPKRAKIREEFPLRGYLICPQCERILTASASTGRWGGKFHYYHCSNGCKERKKANEVNDEFLSVLHSFRVNPETVELYGNILKQSLNENNKTVKADILDVNKGIDKQKQRLQNARALMLDGDITPDDYRAMKGDIESLLNELIVKHTLLLNSGNDCYDEQIDFCIALLKDIDKLYMEANTEQKQDIIGSIFPERLIFVNGTYRTPRLNSVISLVCANHKQLGGGKKEKHPKIEVLSCEVRMKGLELTKR